MGMLLGTRRALAGGGKIRYLLRDEFNEAVAAGSVNGTAADPGPGTRIVADVENKLSISGGRCYFATPATPTWGELGLRYGSLARTAGRILLWQVNIAANSPDSGTGWNDAADFPAWNAMENVVRLGIPSVATVQGATQIITMAGELNTDYLFAFGLRAAGCYYFVKGGTYTNWTLLWIDSSQADATLYPTSSAYSANYSFGFIRIPDELWLPTPLAYDTFTRANGALGSTETSGPDSQAVAARTWNNRVGTTLVAGNVASASALVGGIAIATADTATANVLASGTLTRAGNEVGIVVRYADADNYVRAIHDGTNCKLIKRVAAAETDVISAVVAIGAGAIMVVADGTSFSLYLNNARVGTTQTVSDAALQTGTEQGLFSTNTGNTQDVLTVFPRSGSAYTRLGKF